MGDVEIGFYIPDELIGQACPAEYFGFFTAKISLNNIQEHHIVDYLVHGNDVSSWNDLTDKDWDFMVQESGLKEAYKRLCSKFKEQYNSDIIPTYYPDDYSVVSEGYESNNTIEAAQKNNITTWTLNSILNIDDIMYFITKLGFDNFKDSGVKIVMQSY